MSEYIFSSKNNAFYPLVMKETYEAAQSWPDDGVEVSDDIVDMFVRNYPPEGKIRGVKKGMPVWEDVPDLSETDAKVIAQQKKNSLLSEASSSMSLLQTKLLLNRISEDEKVKLNKWVDYVDAVNSIDVNAPSKITWPKVPK